MLQFIISYCIDVWIFAAVALTATAAVQLWLRRRGHGPLPRLGWVAVITLICVSFLGAMLAGTRERDDLRDRLEGLAPTYAQEVQLMGHSQITLDTPADSAGYMKIIDAEIRWERVNRDVNDIYTYRRRPDGKIVFVVDSETDYDRNGKFDGDREQRTAIGEIYDEVTPNFEHALDGVACFDDEPVTDRWGTWISAYVPLYDADGKVEAALGVDFDAGIWNQSILWSRIGALGVAGVVLAIVTAASAIVTVTRSELRKRERLQRQLLAASRHAGMAEVATGVLHNVGNVLNSVNTSAGVLLEKVRSSKVIGFGKAADIIRENRLDFANFVGSDAKGKMLPDYLIHLSSMLGAEQQEMLGELAQLGRSLDHVKKIVASQQALAKRVDVIETFEVADVVDDALRLNAESIERHSIIVDRRRVNCPVITADRHLVLQILVNLLANSAHAMQDAADRRLTFCVSETTSEAGEKAVSIAITDTGTGISADQLPQLFVHGYTTKTDGHGFGLHHSAIVAHNMGGQLTAVSEGSGRGATFTLVVPLKISEKGVLCLTN